MMEPRWLQERRKEAAQLNAKLPIPTMGENWRRTNFAKVPLDQFTPLPSSKNGANAEATSQHLPLKLLLSGELLYGEQTSPPQLDPALQECGVCLAPLAQACGQKESLVVKYLGRGFQRREEKFLAQNEAQWQTGAFLYMPPNTSVELPLLLTTAFAKEGSSLYPRLLVVLDKGAKATILHFSTSSAQNKNNFVNGVYEIYLEEGANLTWIDLQNWSHQTYEVAHKRTEVGANANLKWIMHLTGGKLSKTNLETVLNGEGANAEVIGLMQGKERQQLELCSITHHAVPHTRADILVKATADERSKMIFQGMIKIDKLAQQTESYMANHNLVLSDKAHADSIPRLEIEADDVKASHGATIGQMDKEQLFYLRSKGLTEAIAERLLIEGFYEDIIGRVPLEPVREWMRGLICHST